MVKSNRLEMAYRFCSPMKNQTIKDEIDSWLIGYSLDDIKLQNGKFECIFSNKDGSTITLSISSRSIRLHRYQNDILNSIKIDEDQIVRQIDIEKRNDGVIYIEIQKQFAPSKRFKNRTVLVDLVEDRYVFKGSSMNRIIDKDDFRSIKPMYILLKIKRASINCELKDICDLYNRFSTHMNYYVQLEGGRNVRDNIYPTRTYLNGTEISNVFDLNDGPDKLYRVFDLYRGIINPRNETDINSINLGLLSPDAFDFKTVSGITDDENNLIGEGTKEVATDYLDYLTQLFRSRFGYKGEFSLDRESLIKAITYRMTGPELAKRQIEIKLGIPYEEYEKLDIAEQHQLIEQKTGKKVKPDYRLYIDGIPMDEEHIITSEQIDKRINSLTESRPKRFFKRLFRIK